MSGNTNINKPGVITMNNQNKPGQNTKQSKPGQNTKQNNDSYLYYVPKRPQRRMRGHRPTFSVFGDL